MSLGAAFTVSLEYVVVVDRQAQTSLAPITASRINGYTCKSSVKTYHATGFASIVKTDTF